MAGLAGAIAVGCGGDGGVEPVGPGGDTPDGGGIGPIDGLGDASAQDSGLDEDSACAAQTAEATLTKKPVDIIVVIDNSGSMSAEIAGVERNINENFAKVLGTSGLDYRVIMVAAHGKSSSYKVCIEEPLSTIPAGDCASPPAQPGINDPRFFHYNEAIGSTNAWCKLLQTYGRADTYNPPLAPAGWSQWLRADAFKAIVVVSDDRASCSFGGKTYNDGNTAAAGETAALAFDADLRALDPAQFNDGADRNYSFYSIVGVANNTPATKAYEPADPIVTGKCATAVNAAPGHQALSRLTGGLRFPLCDTTSYDTVFQAIAEGVIAGSKVECEFPMPAAPPGENINRDSVVVQYSEGGTGAPKNLTKVANAAACAPGAFYLDGETIHLCPETCTAVQEDDAAKIGVLFACETGIK